MADLSPLCAVMVPDFDAIGGLFVSFGFAEPIFDGGGVVVLWADIKAAMNDGIGLVVGAVMVAQNLDGCRAQGSAPIGRDVNAIVFALVARRVFDGQELIGGST